MNMKYKVIAEGPSIPHFYALCDECEWTYQDYRDRERGYKKIRDHVRGTSHTVRLEKSVHTIYRPDSL